MPLHNPVMLTLGWGGRLGATKTLVPVILLGREPRIQQELREAVEAMDQAFILNGYENPCDWIGSYNKRIIIGTNIYSTHAYGTALDVDYGGDTDGDGDPTIDRNPHLHRPIISGDPAFGVEIQLLEHQVRAIESIRNSYGEQMWKWLGWSIGDTMHFQTNVRPERTTVDWSTVGQEGETMVPLDIFVEYVRKVDIEKMGADEIILPSEVAYFTGPLMWSDDNTKVNKDHPDWINLYNAYRVRNPIWAV